MRIVSSSVSHRESMRLCEREWESEIARERERLGEKKQNIIGANFAFRTQSVSTYIDFDICAPTKVFSLQMLEERNRERASMKKLPTKCDRYFHNQVPIYLFFFAFNDFTQSYDTYDDVSSSRLVPQWHTGTQWKVNKKNNTFLPISHFVRLVRIYKYVFCHFRWHSTQRWHQVRLSVEHFNWFAFIPKLKHFCHHIPIQPFRQTEYVENAATSVCYHASAWLPYSLRMLLRTPNGGIATTSLFSMSIWAYERMSEWVNEWMNKQSQLSDEFRQLMCKKLLTKKKPLEFSPHSKVNVFADVDDNVYMKHDTQTQQQPNGRKNFAGKTTAHYFLWMSATKEIVDEPFSHWHSHQLCFD